jgi:endonuclease III
MAKYDPWDAFFRDLEGDSRRLTFEDLETLTSVDLPPSARTHPEWWSRSHHHAVWSRHGWSASPRINEGAVVFRRTTADRLSRVGEEIAAVELGIDADIVLLGCVATKRTAAMAAKDLYSSALWDRRRSYAEASGKPWAILSSEYGLVRPNDVIEPYDRYMGDQSREYQQHWSAETAVAIADWCSEVGASSVEIHAGKTYVAYGLESGLKKRGIEVVRPLAHHRQGEQLAWYDAQLTGMAPATSATSESRAGTSSVVGTAPTSDFVVASRVQKANTSNDVVQALLAYGSELAEESAERSLPEFTPNKAANSFLVSDSWAFLVAVISDYQIRAERAWELPYLLADRLGGWGPTYFTEHPEEVLTAFALPSPLHRFSNQTGEWVVSAARIVVREYGGDAGRIWGDEPRAAVLQERLRRFDGISQKKAAMAVEILERDLGVRVSDLEGSDIAYDVHIRRVFLRTGLAQRDDVDHMVAVARRLHPERPGAMDFPAWMIGREWCRPSGPSCGQCPLGMVCPRLVDGIQPILEIPEPDPPSRPEVLSRRPVPRTREDRIQRAREMAEASSDERAVQRESEAEARTIDIVSLGRSGALAEAKRLAKDDSLGYLGPMATPHEWDQALQAAREVVLETARRRETLTYAELQIAAVQASGRQIGYSMYGTFCMELNHPGQDGCLISSIIVGADTGEPGPGLLPFAESVGFDGTLAELQADVYQTFADPAADEHD